MAPSRLAANAVVVVSTSLNRCAKIRFAMNTGAKASAPPARNRAAMGRLTRSACGISQVSTRDAISAA